MRRSQRRLAGRAVLASVLVGLLGLITACGGLSGAEVRVTGYFERTTGLYPGSSVTILGVPVGSVDSVVPDGDRVRVNFHYDGDLPVPADAIAAVVAPTLVADRHLQLAPGYRGGPVLVDGAIIPLERTAVPVEWNQLEEQLIRLPASLGPNSNDPAGATGRLLRGASGALDGNGAALRDTLAQLRRATAALAGASPNLFTTVRNLNEFVTALNASDDQVRQFATQLAAISRLLNGNRDQLAQLLDTTDRTLHQVDGFVRDNTGRLETTVHELAGITGQLSDQQVHLANVLHVAPTALANAYNSYDPLLGAFSARGVFVQTGDLAATICRGITQFGGPRSEGCKATLAPLLNPFNVPNLPVEINPLIQSGSSHQAGR